VLDKVREKVVISENPRNKGCSGENRNAVDGALGLRRSETVREQLQGYLATSLFQEWSGQREGERPAA
jgi:hypothetical protein